MTHSWYACSNALWTWLY